MSIYIEFCVKERERIRFGLDGLSCTKQDGRERRLPSSEILLIVTRLRLHPVFEEGKRSTAISMRLAVSTRSRSLVSTREPRNPAYNQLSKLV